MRIATAAENMLKNRILPFWVGLKDEEYGGFYGMVDYDLRLYPQAEKGCILNSRILWFFSEVAMLTGDAIARDCAHHAWKFLSEKCVDRRHGGIYWSLRFDGEPLDTTKHCYNQAFAIYALASYYRMSGNPEALKLARELFALVETHFTDAEGYLEAFTRDWQPESNEKLSENGVMAEKTMNTLLHVMEGYAGLYCAWQDPALETALRRIFDIYINRVYNPALHRLDVFFDAHYRSLIDLHSYGHDIEASWLSDWAASLLKDEDLLNRVKPINQAMAEDVYAKAYREQSLLNECERGKDNTTRIWWVQAEAVLGFLNAWQKSGDEKFRNAAQGVWNYIAAKLSDARPGGEWFWSLNEAGVPDRKPIVEPWKCPYHNGRLCMELIRRNPDVEV